jgi:hypothetical protein
MGEMKLKTTEPKKAAPALAPTVPQRKGIINRILHIVIEDVRYKFGRKDTRTDIEKSAALILTVVLA